MVTVVFYELDRLVGLLLVENPFPVLDTLNQNFIDRLDPFTGPEYVPDAIASWYSKI